MPFDAIFMTALAGETYMLSTEICPRYGGHVRSEEIGLMVKETGLVLPCGASGRWEG